MPIQDANGFTLVDHDVATGRTVFLAKIKSLPAQSVLAEMFFYNPDSGKLFRRNRWASKEACAFDASNGYFKTSIRGQKFYVHRIIWKLVFGTEPLLIDHASGVKTDNRLINLRSVSTSGNTRNKCKDRRNTSGFNGVIWDKERCLWKVEINRTTLGRFSDLESAVSARKSAESTLGYHPNHGRAA